MPTTARNVVVWLLPLPALADYVAEAVKKPADDPELADNFHCGRLMLKPKVSRAFWDDADVGLTHNVGGIGQYTFVHLFRRD